MREEAGTALISVRRVVQNGVGAAGAVAVKYQTTTGGTATAGSDYTVVTGTLLWAAGDASIKTFRVPITDDTTREPTETVFLRLYDLVGAGSIAPSRQTAILSILDNEIGDIDTIAPQVTITSPAANANVSNLNTITGTARDEGGSRLLRVDLFIYRPSDRKYWSGTEWVARQVALTTSLVGNVWTRSQGNPTPADLGSNFYQISAMAIDGVGNSKRISQQISVDALPPSLTISLPMPGARLKALARVSGTVSDANGDSSVIVFLKRAVDGKYWNGHEWARATPLPVLQSDSGEWDRTEWPILATGNYSITATATDSLGNSTSVTNEFSIIASTTSGGTA